jgi:lipopolysaccharide/colanic/teichoic acid biosynthesis glycosyltransferase
VGGTGGHSIWAGPAADRHGSFTARSMPLDRGSRGDPNSLGRVRAGPRAPGLRTLSDCSDHVLEPLAPAIAPALRPRTRYERYVKRLLDIVGSSLLLVLTAPLMLVVASGVMVMLGRPIIFRQVRLSRGGVPFTMYKFRSMLPESAVPEDIRGPSEFHAADDSLRHTHFGRLIRRLGLDELPQLWNVLKGDMSLVGPRPELPEVCEAFDLVHHPRHVVRPGMTGAWQVSERRDGFVHLNVHIDEAYVGNLTFRRDLVIVVRTFIVLLGGPGERVHGNTAEDERVVPAEEVAAPPHHATQAV